MSLHAGAASFSGEGVWGLANRMTFPMAIGTVNRAQALVSSGLNNIAHILTFDGVNAL